MNRYAGIWGLAALILAAGCHGNIRTGGPREDLNKGCLQATIDALNLEIARVQGWIDLRKQGTVQDNALPGFEADLKALQADLQRYGAMAPADYQVPEPNMLVIWFEEDSPALNSIVYFDGLSRSGPWYHLAGVPGNDFTVLKPRTRYAATFYKVYPRSYFHMPSSYVYLAEWK